MDVEQLRQDLRDIRIFCGRYFPFVVIPLSYVKIVASEAIPTVGVDERGVMVVNPTWWRSLRIEARRFVAIHEILHCVLMHPLRSKSFNRVVYNIAADGKVNDAITEANIMGIEYRYGDEITLAKISREIGINVDDLKKMSTEEIARELENKMIRGLKAEVALDLIKGSVEGEVVQEGDADLNTNGAELEEKWKRILERAKNFAKQAGKLPAGIERLVDEVLEVKPPWHLLTRFGLRNHSKQDSSFAYQNRRGDDYPGHYGYRYSTWCLVDCSGSISEDELKYFLGIVKHEAKNADVYVIPWDAEAYEVLKATRPSDVARKVAPRMRGGGGTVIAPALRKVLSLMRAGDAIIILTDGYIFDAEEAETQTLFKKVSAKAGFAMLGYTHKPITAPGFTLSRVEFREVGE